jgi:hypothetical protein
MADETFIKVNVYLAYPLDQLAQIREPALRAKVREAYNAAWRHWMYEVRMQHMAGSN